MVRLFLFLGVFFIFYFYDLIFFFPLIISDIFFYFFGFASFGDVFLWISGFTDSNYSQLTDLYNKYKHKGTLLFPFCYCFVVFNMSIIFFYCFLFQVLHSILISLFLFKPTPVFWYAPHPGVPTVGCMSFVLAMN